MFDWFERINSWGNPTPKQLDTKFKSRPRHMLFSDFVKRLRGS